MFILYHSETHRHIDCGTGVGILQCLPALKSLGGMPRDKIYEIRIYFNLFLCNFHVDNLRTPSKTPNSGAYQLVMISHIRPWLFWQVSKAIIQSAFIALLLLRLALCDESYPGVTSSFHPLWHSRNPVSSLIKRSAILVFSLYIKFLIFPPHLISFASYFYLYTIHSPA